MFKVSLLPESYKKFLDGKKKKDLIMKVAVLILFCLLIIYIGFAAKLAILNGQQKKVSQKNSVVTGQIAELQQYKNIYDQLSIAKQRVDAIQPGKPSALKFYSLVNNNRPDYIQIHAISLSEWASNKICTIDGTLPAAQNLAQAIEQLEAYMNTFTADGKYENSVKLVKAANDGIPVIGEDASGSYSFRIFVSLSGAINVDESTGDLITTTTETTTETTTAAGETQAADETANDGSQSSTTVVGETQPATTNINDNAQTEPVGETNATPSETAAQ